MIESSAKEKFLKIATKMGLSPEAIEKISKELEAKEWMSADKTETAVVIKKTEGEEWEEPKMEKEESKIYDVSTIKDEEVEAMDESKAKDYIKRCRDYSMKKNEEALEGREISHKGKHPSSLAEVFSKLATM